MEVLLSVCPSFGFKGRCPQCPSEKTPSRLASWRPGAVHCPLDREIETMEHAMTTCRFLPFAFDTIPKCFLQADVDGATVSDVKTLPSNYLDSTFEFSAGIMAWLAITVNWGCRCQATTKVPTWHQFVRIWIPSVKRWTALPHPTITRNDLAQFADALISLLDEAKLLHPNLHPTAPTPIAPTSHSRRLSQARKSCQRLPKTGRSAFGFRRAGTPYCVPWHGHLKRGPL